MIADSWHGSMVDEQYNHRITLLSKERSGEKERRDDHPSSANPNKRSVVTAGTCRAVATPPEQRQRQPRPPGSGTSLDRNAAAQSRRRELQRIRCLFRRTVLSDASSHGRTDRQQNLPWNRGRLMTKITIIGMLDTALPLMG